MNWLDLVIIIIIGFTAIRSLFRGLIREIAEVAGMIAAIFLAYEYYEKLGNHLFVSFNVSPAIANIVAFAAILIGTAVAAGLLGWLLSKALKFTPINLADRLGGMGFGFIKGFLLVCILVGVLSALPFSFTYTTLEQSYLARKVAAVLPQIYTELESLFPENFPRWDEPSKTVQQPRRVVPDEEYRNSMGSK